MTGRHEPLSVRDQLAIWLAVHVAGAVRMDVVELADQILAGPLRDLLVCSGCSLPGGRHWDTCPNRGDGRPTR